jgi:hypothetical protein
MINNAYQLDLFCGLSSTEFIDYSELLQTMPVKGCASNKTLKQAINSIRGVARCQLSLTFNLIRIDKGLLLAPNGKRLKRTWVVANEGQNALVDSLLNDFIASSGKKRAHKDKYRTALSMLLANLLNAHRTRSGLIVLKRTHHSPDPIKNPLNITPTIINQLTDFFASVGLVTSHTGKSNEYEGCASWLAPNEELRIRLDYSNAEIALAKGSPAIVLKSEKDVNGNKDLCKLPTSNAAKREITRLSKPVNEHTKTWLEHRVTYRGNTLVPFIKRTFNNSSLAFGGRFYSESSTYQNLSKDKRKELLIDGATTVEIDYKAIHFNLLYAWTNATAPKDPYIIKGYSRDMMKSVCLVLVNSDNLAAFKRNVTKSGNPEVIDKMRRYKDRLSVYNEQRGLGLKAKAPVKPESKKGFIEGIPEGTKGIDLLAAIENAHGAIKHFFGTPNIGLRLQYLDSEIMALAITKLQGLPVLPVHDSLICKLSDYLEVETAMLDAYHELTDRTITVTDNLTRRF